MARLGMRGRGGEGVAQWTRKWIFRENVNTVYGPKSCNLALRGGSTLLYWMNGRAGQMSAILRVDIL